MWEILYFVIIAVIAVAMAPKPPNAAPPSLIEPGSIPTAEPGRPIPVVFGTCLVKAPNVVWYGDIAYGAVYA